MRFIFRTLNIGNENHGAIVFIDVLKWPAIFIFSLGAIVSCSVYGRSSMTVYYIPFSVETYTPVTEDSLFCDYKLKYFTDVKNKIMEVDRIVVSGKKTTETFDGSLVRVKVIFDKDAIYIDRNGVFEREGNTYQVDIKAFSSFMEDNAVYTNENIYNDPECKY